MRTDTLKLTPLLLVAALLAGGPPGLAAQEEKPDPVRIRERAAALEEARRQLDSARAEMTRELASIEEEMERELAAAERESAQAGEAGVSVRTGNQVIPRGEVVQGDLVVHDGDLRIEGEVRGNVVVTGGDLTIVKDASVLGDAKVIGGALNNEGRVMGEMLTISAEGPRRPRAAAPPAPPEFPREARGARSRDSWFAPIGRGISDFFGWALTAAVVAGIGAALVFYSLPRLRTVSETLRASTGRAAAVGTAATILIVPVFVLGVVALGISIIGIPLLLVAVPLYPLVVIALFVFGLIAAAHAIGEKTVDQRSEFGLRHRNAYSYVFLGVGILVAPLLLASIIEMVPFLDWLSTLLEVISILALLGVSMVGMGAVILTRGGTQRVAPPADFDPVLDDDPLFDAEPAVR